MKTSSAIGLIKSVPVKPNFLKFIIVLLINLLKMYPCSVLLGITPSLIMKTAALMWSAMILNSFLFFLYCLFERCSISFMIGCHAVVR